MELKLTRTQGIMRSARYVLWLVLFAVSIEVAVRVDDWIAYNASVLENFNDSNLYELDKLGRHGKPNAQYLKWKLNSLGFRGPELQPGTLRIATAGASETFGLYESIDHEWPRELERSLNSRPGSVPIEVVNLALPGVLISTFEKRLPEMIRKTSPQVLIIYPSSVSEIHRPGNFQFLAKKDIKSHVKQTPELRIGDRAKTVIKNNIPKWLLDWLHEQLVKRNSDNAIANTPVVMDRVPDRVLDNYRDDIKRIIADLRADDIVPVLVTQATYFGPHLDLNEYSMMLAWHRFYPMLTDQGLLDMEARANAVLKEIALSEHLILIDAAAKMPEGEEFFADFVHFTDRGSHLFSELIAERLQCIRQQGTECLADTRTQPSQPKSPHSFQNK